MVWSTGSELASYEQNLISKDISVHYGTLGTYLLLQTGAFPLHSPVLWQIRVVCPTRMKPLLQL